MDQVQDTPQPDQQSAPKTKLKTLWENFSSIGVALLVVLMIRSSIVESFKIPSGSLIPTLAIGDYLFVNKLAYGFKFPFTNFVLIPTGKPHRGDIIVFRWPRNESIYFIKRVVGVPGDVVEVRDKQLYVNHQPVPREQLSTPQTDEVVDSKVLFDPEYTVQHPIIYNENLDGKHHLMMLDSTSYRARNFDPVTVPEGNYFAMGDNRDVSNDSRGWGFVPEKNIAGKAMLIWLCLWMDFDRGEIVFHPNRIGTLIK